MIPDPKTHCADDLRRRILSQELRPGEDLDETGLSDHYGISRTPLREILQRLAGEGFITLSRNRGARVTPMDLATLRVFFQTAPLIYSSIARLAAGNRTEAQLDALREVQHGFAGAVSAGRTEEAAMANHRFHELIGEMAHNDYLMRALKRLLIDHTRLGQIFYNPGTSSERGSVLKAVRQHDAMIDAIAAHDAAVASGLTLEHWDLSRDRMERFARPDPLPLDVTDFKEKKDAV